MFGRTARRAVTEQTMDDGGFHLIIKRRRSAVGVDITDVIRIQSGHIQRHVDRTLSPQPFRMRRRHVPRIGGFAHSQQRHIRRFPGQQDKRSGFPNINAVAVLPERCTSPVRQGFETVKAVDRHPAQAVCAPDDCRIHQPGFDQPLSADDGPRAGRARRGKRVSRSAQIQKFSHKLRRIAELLLGIIITLWEFTVLMKIAHGLFTLGNPRRTGTHDHRNAIFTVLRDRRLDLCFDLRQRGQ